MSRLNDRSQAILRALNAGAKTIADVCDATGFEPTFARQRVYELVQANFARSQEQKGEAPLYTITNIGRTAIGAPERVIQFPDDVAQPMDHSYTMQERWRPEPWTVRSGGEDHKAFASRGYRT